MEQHRIVTFTIEEQLFGVAVEHVQRIQRMVEITPLQDASPLLLGCINVHGTVVPVVNLRRRFFGRTRPVQVSDHLILVRHGERLLALAVDTVTGLEIRPGSDLKQPDESWTGTATVEGIIPSPTGLVMVQNLEVLLRWTQDLPLLTEAAPATAQSSEIL